MDALERELSAIGRLSGTVAILQRFLPDDLFTVQQQARLGELMEQFHAAVAVGEAIAPQVHEELESLVEAELKATISRTAKILKQTSAE